MTKKTRYFIAGSGAVLAAGLGTGLVAYFSGGFQSVAAAPVANELRYVPADAAVVAYADVRSIMDSDLRQRLKIALPMHGDGQQEFQAKTGIDIGQRSAEAALDAIGNGSWVGLMFGAMTGSLERRVEALVEQQVKPGVLSQKAPDQQGE